MNEKWKDMSCKDKVLVVVSVIVSVIALVFAVLDLADVWVYAEVCWHFSFAAMFCTDGARQWQKKRKAAIVDLALGAVFLGLGVAGLFL